VTNTSEHFAGSVCLFGSPQGALAKRGSALALHRKYPRSQPRKVGYAVSAVQVQMACQNRQTRQKHSSHSHPCSGADSLRARLCCARVV